MTYYTYWYWTDTNNPSTRRYDYRFMFVVSSTQNVSANTSTVTVEQYIIRKDVLYSDLYYTTGTVAGVNINRSKTLSAGGEGQVTSLIGSGSTTVSHNSDGTKTISFSGAGRSDSGQTIYTGSKSITLPNIPRYTSITTYTRTNITLNSFRVNWASADTVDRVEYRINSGSWTLGQSGDRKSGNFTVSGRSPNTTYKIQIRVRRKDSQLWKESSNVDVKTLDIAKYTSVPNNIDVDKPFTVSFNRNGASTVELGIYKGGSVAMAAYRTVSGSSYTFNLTQAEKNAFYNDMSGDKTNTYGVFIATNSNAYRESHNRTFEIKDADPTFSGFTWKPADTGTPVLTGWNSDISVDNNKTIQGKTRYVITCSAATPKKGATISRYEASINNIVVSSSTPSITLSAPVSGDGNLVVKAIDSRGNYGSITKAIKTIPYTNPSFTSSPTFTRRGYPNGHLLNVVIKAKVAKLMYETSYWGVSYLFRPRIQGAVWSEEFSLDSSSTIDSDGYITFSGQLSQSFNTDYAYDFQIFISDYYIDVPVNGNATSDTPLLSKRKGRIGINKVAQEGYSLDVGGGVNIDKFLQFSEAMTSNDKGMIFKKTGSGFDFLRIVDGEMYLNNKRVAKISYGTSAPPTLEDGEIYFRY